VSARPYDSTRAARDVPFWADRAGLIVDVLGDLF
jgi:hypothetical protein